MRECSPRPPRKPGSGPTGRLSRARLTEASFSRSTAGRTPPTTIFEASIASDPDRGSLRVEVAIPRGIERNALDDWIRQGIGCAPGIRSEQPGAVRCAGALAKAQVISGLAAGSPVHTPASGLSAASLFHRRPASVFSQVPPCRRAMTRLSEEGGKRLPFRAHGAHAVGQADPLETEWREGDGRRLHLPCSASRPRLVGATSTT